MGWLALEGSVQFPRRHNEELEEAQLGDGQMAKDQFRLALHARFLPVGEQFVHQLVDQRNDPIIDPDLPIDKDL